jgi:hypothetical protein
LAKDHGGNEEPRVLKRTMNRIGAENMTLLPRARAGGGERELILNLGFHRRAKFTASPFEYNL